MKHDRLFLGALLLAISAPAMGCTVYTRPPPDTVVEVSDAPPPPPAEVEVVPPSPGVEYVWIGGHQRWTGQRYVWERGHYDRRPNRNARFVRAHWEHRGRATVWVDGHWG